MWRKRGIYFEYCAFFVAVVRLQREEGRPGSACHISML